MKIDSLDDAMEFLGNGTLGGANDSEEEEVTIDTLLDDSADYITDTELLEHLTTTLKDIGYSSAFVIKKAAIPEILGFQIFSGIATPTRETLLRICLAATFTVSETQKALEIAGYQPLNPYNARDKILIHGLSYMESVFKVNENLYNQHEDLI